jgi:hypothetical protein
MLGHFLGSMEMTMRAKHRIFQKLTGFFAGISVYVDLRLKLNRFAWPYLGSSEGDV